MSNCMKHTMQLTWQLTDNFNFGTKFRSIRPGILQRLKQKHPISTTTLTPFNFWTSKRCSSNLNYSVVLPARTLAQNEMSGLVQLPRLCFHPVLLDNRLLKNVTFNSGVTRECNLSKNLCMIFLPPNKGHLLEINHHFYFILLENADKTFPFPLTPLLSTYLVKHTRC